jgi:hypothetical protein
MISPWAFFIFCKILFDRTITLNKNIIIFIEQLKQVLLKCFLFSLHYAVPFLVGVITLT